MTHPAASFGEHTIASEPALPPACWKAGPSRRTVSCVIVACVVGIVLLLGLGRLVVAAWPTHLEIAGSGRSLEISVDGVGSLVELPAPVVAVRPMTPVRYRREHQIDGSDSTNMFTFSPGYFNEFGTSPYYVFQAWLREEWRYSRWANLEVTDGNGVWVARQAYPTDEINIPVPATFRLRIDLERPEIPRVLELIDADQRLLLLEVNRNDKYVRLGRQRMPERSDLYFTFYPRDLRAPLATLLDLLTRAAALALGLVLAVGLVAALAPSPVRWLPGARTLAVCTVSGVAIFLAASWYVGTALFERTPHILDGIAYLFQAKTFAGGSLTVAPAPVTDTFTVPFSTVHHGRWFAQYPPGTAATLAPGVLAGAPWLVQPVLAALTVVLVVLTVRRQYGDGTALLVALLLVTSPFLLLTAGSFLSHVPALFFAMISVYAVRRYAERPTASWAALVGLGLALALLTREIVPVLFGSTLILAGAVRAAPMRGRALLLDAVIVGLALLFSVMLYLAYNWAVTDDPLTLPRLLVNGRDRWGFGSGIGFYNEHTLASGLVNSEEQLVSLGFSLAGWPFGFSLALMLLPFILRRASSWDAAHGCLVAFYVVAYAAYFYHGVTFGPRYYFEALPSMLILSVRGFGALTDTVTGWLVAFGYVQPWWRARQAAGLLFVALLACNLTYYLPRQAALYARFSGYPGGGPALDQNIGYDLSGRVSRLDNALVVTDDWWYYTLYFAVMNCPRLDCATIFTHAGDDQTREALRREYSTRQWYSVIERRGVLVIEPGSP